MDLGLKGKVAMVAGASRGLGYAVAEALARDGAQVSIASRDEAAIKAAAARLGGDVLAMPVDVRSADAIRRWADDTEQRFGGVDLLFTNSGGPPAGAAMSFDDAAWQEAAELLLFSTLRMVRAAVPLMQARGGGAILMSTSASVKEPIPNLGLSTVLRASVSASRSPGGGGVSSDPSASRRRTSLATSPVTPTAAAVASPHPRTGSLRPLVRAAKPGQTSARPASVPRAERKVSGAPEPGKRRNPRSVS